MAKNSLDETRALKVLLAQVRGFCESIQDILHNKDTAEIGRYTSFRDMAHTYNDLAETARVLLRVPSMFYTFNVDEMPSWGDSVWPVQKKILEQVWVSAKLLYSSLEGSIDFVDDEFRFLYKGIIIKHNKTEPTYTKTSLFLCEKRRFFMARTEKGVVTTI